MPSSRKLSAAAIAAQEQPTLGIRALIAREYDAYVAGFAAGDYGRAELHEGERRDTVRRQLQAAARRRGLALRFRSGPGPLTFHVEAAPAPVASPPPPTPAAAQRRNEAARRDPAPPRPSRPPRQRQSSTERYSDVLPRWMREGQPPGRRGASKRRVR